MGSDTLHPLWGVATVVASLAAAAVAAVQRPAGEVLDLRSLQCAYGVHAQDTARSDQKLLIAFCGFQAGSEPLLKPWLNLPLNALQGEHRMHTYPVNVRYIHIVTYTFR